MFNYEENEKKAIERYEAGEPLCFSTSIGDFATAGYGHLDEYGHWEYPLPYLYVMKALKND